MCEMELIFDYDDDEVSENLKFRFFALQGVI